MELFDKGVLVNIISYPEPKSGDREGAELKRHLSPIRKHVIIFTNLSMVDDDALRHQSLDIAYKQPPEIDDGSKVLLVVDRKTVKFSIMMRTKFITERFHLTFYKLLITMDSTGNNSRSKISPWILEENLKEAMPK